MVMAIEPADYDIATSARPEEIVEIFPRTESIGAQFGVILVIYRGHRFEVATFRSDEAYLDGRRPTQIEPRTWQAVAAMAPRIHQVSSERIREEVCRILTEGRAARGFRLMEESGLRREIFPEVEWTGHIEASLRFLKPGALADFAMGVLLHHTPLSSAATIVERLKFSRAEMHHILALIGNLPQFSRVRQLSVAEIKRFFRLNRFEDHVELARIHLMADGKDLSDVNYVLGRLAAWTDKDIYPEPLITGDDLIAIGFPPGPVFKEILTIVEDAQLEGRLRNRSEALDFVKGRYGQP